MVNKKLGRGLDALFGDLSMTASGNDVLLGAAGSSLPDNGDTLFNKGKGGKPKPAVPFQLDAASDEKARSVPPLQRNADSDESLGADRVIDIELEQIMANPFQPRSEFDDESIDNLAESMKHNGLLQPIIVTRKGGSYELVCGERRVRAARKLGMKNIRAIVVKTMGDEELLRKALIENIQREDLNPIEKAEAFSVLCKKFQLTHEKIAELVGVNRATVTNFIRLLELPEEVREAVRSNLITAGHARAILQVSEPVKRAKLITAIVKDNLTVRQAENMARKLNDGLYSRAAKVPPAEEADYATAEIIKFLEDAFLTKVELTVSGGKYVVSMKFENIEQLTAFATNFGYTP